MDHPKTAVRAGAQKPPSGSSALRHAAANSLRLAASNLDDAHLLLNAGSASGAILVKQALAHVIRAVAASEHGWPLEERDAGLAAIPEENPVQPELAAVERLLGDGAAPTVRKDGRLSPEPDSRRVSRALEQATSVLEAVGRAFEADLAGTGPARRVSPIRPAPVAEPPKPMPPDEPKVMRRKPEARSPTAADRAHADPPAREPRRQPTAVPASGKATPREKPAKTPNPTPKPDPRAEAGPGEGEPPPNRGAPEASSTAFWSQMDRWKVEDLAALDLIGHPGGLTKTGTRPRFRVAGEERPITVHIPLAMLPDGRPSFDDNLHGLLERKRGLMREALLPPDPSDGELRDMLDRTLR